MAELELRNDVYRRPLATALGRVGAGAGWLCADVGAGAGDVTVALARIVGPGGRVYAIDADPEARNAVASAAAQAGNAQIVAITQAAEELVLPEPIDLVFCRFLLLHVFDPLKVLCRMAAVIGDDGYLVAQEPITSAGRVAGMPFAMPDARHPDVGALLPACVREAGLELVDAWAEAPAGAGPGPVSAYLEQLTDVELSDEPVVLPPLVTVIARPKGHRIEPREHTRSAIAGFPTALSNKLVLGEPPTAGRRGGGPHNLLQRDRHPVLRHEQRSR